MQRVAARDVDTGAVVTKPRNFTTRPLLKGKDDTVYFQRPLSYNCRGDLYQNPSGDCKRTEVKDGWKIVGKQDVNWKYAKTIRNKYGYKASYEHMNDRVEIKKNYRDADGAVITAPRNFTTKPMKKGNVGPGTSFGGHAPHMKCEYDVAKEMARKEMQLH